MEIGQKTFQTSSKRDKISDYKLSIQVSLSGLSFCVLNKKSNILIHYSKKYFDKILNPSDVLTHLKNHLSVNKILQQDFVNVTLIHENNLSTLVPEVLFDENNLSDYLKFNSKILSNDFITFDKLLKNSIINVYVPYVNINNFIFETFGSFEFNHYSTILLNTLFKVQDNSSQTQMYVNINNTHFEITVFEQSILVLHNTFDYATKEDFIYYVLFSAEQLQLDPEKFPLVLMGKIALNDDLYKIAYAYIRNVRIYESKMDYSLEINNKQEFAQNFVLTNSF